MTYQCTILMVLSLAAVVGGSVLTEEPGTLTAHDLTVLASLSGGAKQVCATPAGTPDCTALAIAANNSACDTIDLSTKNCNPSAVSCSTRKCVKEGEQCSKNQPIKTCQLSYTKECLPQSAPCGDVDAVSCPHSVVPVSDGTCTTPVPGSAFACQYEPCGAEAAGKISCRWLGCYYMGDPPMDPPE